MYPASKWCITYTPPLLELRFSMMFSRCFWQCFLQLKVEQLEEENQALSLQELSLDSQARLEQVEREVSQLTSLLEEQHTWVYKQIELCTGDSEALQVEMREVEEGTRITEAVNTATQLQLKVRGGRGKLSLHDTWRSLVQLCCLAVEELSSVSVDMPS